MTLLSCTIHSFVPISLFITESMKQGYHPVNSYITVYYANIKLIFFMFFLYKPHIFLTHVYQTEVGLF